MSNFHASNKEVQDTKINLTIKKDLELVSKNFQTFSKKVLKVHEDNHALLSQLPMSMHIAIQKEIQEQRKRDLMAFVFIVVILLVILLVILFVVLFYMFEATNEIKKYIHIIENTSNKMIHGTVSVSNQIDSMAENLDVFYSNVVYIMDLLDKLQKSISDLPKILIKIIQKELSNLKLDLSHIGTSIKSSISKNINKLITNFSPSKLALW